MYKIIVRCSNANHEPGIVVVGPKPGEKMYEELMNSEEVRRTKNLKLFLYRPCLPLRA